MAERKQAKPKIRTVEQYRRALEDLNTVSRASGGAARRKR